LEVAGGQGGNGGSISGAAGGGGAGDGLNAVKLRVRMLLELSAEGAGA